MSEKPGIVAASEALAAASGLAPECGMPALLRAIAAQLERTAPADVVIEEYGASLHAGDFALASLAAAGHDEALERVYTQHAETAARAVRSARVQSALAEDVLAKVWERVLVGTREGAAPSIASYSGRGALGAWLHVSVVRDAHHAARAAARFTDDPEDEDADARLGSAAGGELEYMKGLYAEAFGRAFRAALASLDPRHRSVLRSTYVEGLSADKLAQLYGVHRVTVARWLGDARLALAGEARRLLAASLALPTEESESILRLIRSRLDVSLRALDAGAFEASP